MSIPSVRFKAPPRKPYPQRGQPNSRPSANSASTSNYHRPNDKLASIDFSSDESDDLPVIQTSQKVKHTLIEIEASSDEDDSNHNDMNSDGEIKEVDWGSKNAKPDNFMPRKTSHTSSSGSGNPIRSRINQSSISVNVVNNNNQQGNSQESSENQQYSSNNQQAASDSSNNGQNAQNAQHRRRRRVRKPPQGNGGGAQQSTISRQNINLHNSEEDEDEENGEIVVQRPNLNGRSQQNQIQYLSSSSTTNNTNSAPNNNNGGGNNNNNASRFARSHTLDSFNNGPINDGSNNNNANEQANSMQTFVVVREKKAGKKIQADFRMMQNEAAIFFSKVHKDEIGISYLVSKVIPVVAGSADIFGILRKQDHGKRFTVYTTDEKYNDDRDPEAVGMAFVKLPEIKSKQRTFRLSFRADGGINYPISKRRELSRIAENGEAIPEVKLLVNKPPVIGPDGSLINFFGSMYVVDSLKNYIVCDEKDEPIFMIFKSSEASFTVKAKFPITPLMAFGLSIAIIEDCR